MGFKNPFSDEEMAFAASQEVTLDILLRSVRMGTLALSKFGYETMLPIYEGQIRLSDRETAIGMSFYRLLGAVRTSANLVQTYQFQALGATTRTAFELCVDLAILTRGLVPNAVEKFHGFTRAARFSAALKVVRFYDLHPELERIQLVQNGQRVASSSC